MSSLLLVPVKFCCQKTYETTLSFQSFCISDCEQGVADLLSVHCFFLREAFPDPHCSPHLLTSLILFSHNLPSCPVYFSSGWYVSILG